MHSMVASFRTTALAVSCAVLSAGATSAATLLCGQPTAANGTVIIEMKALGEPPCRVVVTGINDNMGPGLKGIHIRDAINAACTGAPGPNGNYTATGGAGGIVVITTPLGNPVLVGKKDDTGETDGFAAGGGIWQTVVGGNDIHSEPTPNGVLRGNADPPTASGISFGGGPGFVAIGTNHYIASVPTSAGELESTVLDAIYTQLVANGVANASFDGDSIVFDVSSPSDTVWCQIEDTGLDISMVLHLISAATVPPMNASPSLELAQNVPNPVAWRTTIAFTLPASGPVTLDVLDLQGRTIATLLHGAWKPAGRHEVSFATEGLSPGVYLYRVQASGRTLAHKMQVLDHH